MAMAFFATPIQAAENISCPLEALAPEERTRLALILIENDQATTSVVNQTIIQKAVACAQERSWSRSAGSYAALYAILGLTTGLLNDNPSVLDADRELVDRSVAGLTDSDRSDWLAPALDAHLQRRNLLGESPHHGGLALSFVERSGVLLDGSERSQRIVALLVGRCLMRLMEERFQQM